MNMLCKDSSGNSREFRIKNNRIEDDKKYDPKKEDDKKYSAVTSHYESELRPFDLFSKPPRHSEIPRTSSITSLFQLANH